MTVTLESLNVLLSSTLAEISGRVLTPDDTDYNLVIRLNKIKFCIDCLHMSVQNNVTFLEYVAELE